MLRVSDIASLDDTELAEANIEITTLLHTIQQEIYKRAAEKKYGTLLDELNETQGELRTIRTSLNIGLDSDEASSESSDNPKTPPRDYTIRPPSPPESTDNNQGTDSNQLKTSAASPPPSPVTSSTCTATKPVSPTRENKDKEKTLKDRTPYSKRRLRQRT